MEGRSIVYFNLIILLRYLADYDLAGQSNMWKGFLFLDF